MITHAIPGLSFWRTRARHLTSSRSLLLEPKNEFGSSMVKIRSDNGSEFHNTRVEEYCDGEGIKHEFSSTYTPQKMVW
jgi:hypothetical protein